MDSSNLQIDGIDLTDLLEDDSEPQPEDANSLSGVDQSSERLRAASAALAALHVSPDHSAPHAAATAGQPYGGSFKERSAQRSMVGSPPPPNAVLRGSVDPFLTKYRLDTHQTSHSFGGTPSTAEGLPYSGPNSSSSYSASGLGWNGGGNPVTSPTRSDKNGSPSGSPSTLRTRFGMAKPQTSVAEAGSVASERTGERGEASDGGRDGGMEGGADRKWNAHEMAIAGSPVRNAALSIRVRAGANPAAVEAYLRIKAQREGMTAARVVRK
ncbi:hypothetical protein CLOM_g21623 [Closterium sp. NIES-68]|nr:hypothetical protein CLOM_g21623 [Closterium sp. NIES-68]